jgi:death on curing protein
VNEPKWLRKETVLGLHSLSISQFGGAQGVRDQGMLESALNRPLNKWGYENASIVECAVAYAYGIAMNHPFVDGNKRTAFLAMGVFLEKNGYRLTATEPDSTTTFLKLAAGEMTETELVEWLRSNIQ